MAGTMVVDTLQSSLSTPPVFKNTSGTEVGQLCRAWINFDASTTPPTIRTSFNISSISRLATGRFQISFTTAMPDANYVAAGQASVDGTFGSAGLVRLVQLEQTSTVLTGSCVIGTATASSTVTQAVITTVSFFR
jgi:hypothetical protein